MSASEQALLELAQTEARRADPPPDIDQTLAADKNDDPAELSAMPDGRRIGRYVLLSRLGEGSMGVVYAAYDTDLDRKVAIKLVRHNRLGESHGHARVIREAQAMAQISHPNVVHVYEVGKVQAGASEEQVYIAMEFVAGMDLHRWQKREERRFQAIVQMYIQAGEGLWAAHRSNLIHRDFKPDNVLVGDDGRARVADFGLARSLQGTEPPLASVSRAHNLDAPLAERLTEAGTVMGTPSYMSPEQHRGSEVDARSDQFSFCAALYEALFKQGPIAGETRAQLAENALMGRVRPPPKSDLPPALIQTLLRGLSVDPAARFPSMRELLDDLRSESNVDLPGSRRARRLVSWVFAGAVMASSVPGLLAEEAPPIQHVVALPVFVGVFVFAVTAANYRRLRQSPDHWALVLLVSLFLVQAFTARVVAVRMGLTLFQYLPIDHVILAGFSAVAAYGWMPRMWIGVILAAISGLLAALSPDLFWKVSVIVYPLVILLFVLWWPKRPQPPPPLAPPRQGPAGVLRTH